MISIANPRLAILISGRGSNMQSIIEACQAKALKADVCVVISNNPKSSGLVFAEASGLKTECINHRDYISRELFDEALLSALKSAEADIVILAGFIRILTPILINPFLGRLINIHPSLLPKYPGLNTHQRAIDAGDNEAGATVHFVTKELDDGPSIIQARVPILADDSADTLAARVLEKEHEIYLKSLGLLIEKRIELRCGKVFFEGTALPSSGILHD